MLLRSLRLLLCCACDSMVSLINSMPSCRRSGVLLHCPDGEPRERPLGKRVSAFCPLRV